MKIFICICQSSGCNLQCVDTFSNTMLKQYLMSKKKKKVMNEIKISNLAIYSLQIYCSSNYLMRQFHELDPE